MEFRIVNQLRYQGANDVPKQDEHVNHYPYGTYDSKGSTSQMPNWQVGEVYDRRWVCEWQAFDARG